MFVFFLFSVFNLSSLSVAENYIILPLGEDFDLNNNNNNKNKKQNNSTKRLKNIQNKPKIMCSLKPPFYLYLLFYKIDLFLKCKIFSFAVKKKPNY